MRLTALREQINRKYEDKETLFRAFTTADTKLTGLRAEKEKLDAKLHEDYDMTLPEAQTMAEAMHWEPVTPENSPRGAGDSDRLPQPLAGAGAF